MMMTMGTTPKHKGREHLQASIMSRIKKLSDQLAGPSKAGARTGPTTPIRPEGAAQLVASPGFPREMYGSQAWEAGGGYRRI
jgi:ribosome-interacting GTPase 1